MKKGGCSAQSIVGHWQRGVGRKPPRVRSYRRGKSRHQNCLKRRPEAEKARAPAGHGGEARGPKSAQRRHYQDHQGSGELLGLANGSRADERAGG